VSRELRNKAQAVPLQEKPFQILTILLERPGELVTREELRERLWPADTFVDFEHSINTAVKKLREALGDDAERPDFIETLPRRGYRFIGPVDGSLPETGASPPSEPAEPTRSRWRRWPVAVVMALAGIALLLLVTDAGEIRSRWEGRSPKPSRATPAASLAVLPVQNLTGDPSREFLSDGLTEELILQLGVLDPGKLSVIARTSSMAYKGSNKTIPEIGKELKVNYLLEGSIREAGGRLRVTEQLVRASDGTHLWAQSYDRELGDLLRMETEVANAVAIATSIHLTDAERTKLAKANTVNAEAYQAYLQGRFYWNTRTREGLLKSIDYFHQALQFDPEDARAYAGLADAYNLLVYYGYATGTESSHRATDAARKALELDESLPEAHTALAYANFFSWWKWPEAEQEFRRAIELDNNYVPAHHWYAIYLSAMGRRDESVEQMERARELDPLSPAVRAGSAFVDYFSRHYDDAVKECDTALAANPQMTAALYVRGLAYEAQGQFDKAIADFQSALDRSGVRTDTYEAALGHAYAMAGKRQEAEEIEVRLEERSKREYVGPTTESIIWAGLGEREKAVERLKRASETNDNGMIWLRVDPRWDGVRSDPWVQSWLAHFEAGAHNPPSYQ
jgi:TolB-like protein/DNA-binding winged helix-turn-helix (wHTH) protein